MALRDLALLDKACEALARRPGTRIHALVGIDPKFVRRSRWTASIVTLPFDSYTDEQAVNAINETISSVEARVILPVAIDDVAFVSKYRHQLDVAATCVAVPSPELLDKVANKLHFSLFAKSLDMPIPLTIEVTADLKISEVTALLAYPFLAKPTVSAAGEGVRFIKSDAELVAFLGVSRNPESMMLQEWVEGEDVALTLLASEGDVFAVMMRKRWFTRRCAPVFSPIRDVEFFQCDWLEELGRKFVKATHFSGIADFDLKVDFKTKRAWFLEADPRLMGGTDGAMLFGMNVPSLLVDHALGKLSTGECRRADLGYFLSSGSLAEWTLRESWRQPRWGKIRTNLFSQLADPATFVARCFHKKSKRREIA